jgi:hypothetical protein
MNVREVIRALVSGCLVYVAVSMCTAESGNDGSTPGGQDAYTADSVGVGHDGSSSLVDSVVDTLLDPTADASAEQPDREGSRLKRKYLVGDDGSRQTWGGWWDSELGVDCGFRIAADGEYRCTPVFSASIVNLFKDESCTVRAVSISKETCGAGIKYAQTVEDGCPIKTRVYAIGQMVTSEVAYTLDTDDNCIEKDVSGDKYDGINIHAVGPEVSASSFVKAELIVSD